MATKTDEPTAHTTKIVQCNCTHDYQDKRYGKGRRVANATMDRPPKYHCTVCKREHS